MIEVEIGKCTRLPTASLEEGVRLFFICCLGQGYLLLLMSAIMDAWVRGKVLLLDVTL